MLVKPFRGVRPNPKYVEIVNTPPYDVVDSDDVERFTKNNPYSFFHIIRAEAEMKNIDEHSQAVYDRARDNFDRFVADGVLAEDDRPHFYIYSQTWNSRTQVGVFAAASCEEYEQGKIKINEYTLPEKEKDRTDLLLDLGVHTGPVFLSFKDNQGYHIMMEKIQLAKPTYEFCDENGVENKLWTIDDEAGIAEISDYFKWVDSLYICDGHHRSAAANNARKIKMKENSNHNGGEDYNFFPVVIFPSSQLQILPYNRIVKSLNGMTETEFIDKVKETFDVSKTDKLAPEAKGEIIMYINKKLFLLKIKDGIVDQNHPVDSLDVSILQNYMFSAILGIDDPRISKNIKFVGGIKGAGELIKQVDDGNAIVSFSMYPVSMDELINISDSGMIMPPKSTWFEPKLRSGLVSHKI